MKWLLQSGGDWESLRKPQASNEMHKKVVALFWKLFARITFCMAAYWISAGWLSRFRSEKSAPPEAPTHRPRPRRLRAQPTKKYHNVIRLHTIQRSSFLQAGRPSAGPPTQRIPLQPSGKLSPRPTEKTIVLAKNRLVFRGRSTLPVRPFERSKRPPSSRDG